MNLFNTVNRTSTVKVSSDTFERIYAAVGATGICSLSCSNSGYSINLKALRILLSHGCKIEYSHIPLDLIQQNIVNAFSAEFKKVKKKIASSLNCIDVLFIVE